MALAKINSDNNKRGISSILRALQEGMGLASGEGETNNGIRYGFLFLPGLPSGGLTRFAKSAADALVRVAPVLVPAVAAVMGKIVAEKAPNNTTQSWLNLSDIQDLAAFEDALSGDDECLKKLRTESPELWKRYVRMQWMKREAERLEAMKKSITGEMRKLMAEISNLTQHSTDDLNGPLNEFQGPFALVEGSWVECRDDIQRYYAELEQDLRQADSTTMQNAYDALIARGRIFEHIVSRTSSPLNMSQLRGEIANMLRPLGPNHPHIAQWVAQSLVP